VLVAIPIAEIMAGVVRYVNAPNWIVEWRLNDGFDESVK
jgi:hypothetical protein